MVEMIHNFFLTQVKKYPQYHSEDNDACMRV